MTKLLRKFPNDPIPTKVLSAEECFLHLEGGRTLLDFTGGWTAHNVLGYSDPDVKRAIKQQLDIYPHVDTNIWTNPVLDELAEITLDKAPSGLNKVYFGGLNGSDAIEAAMKLSFHVHSDSGRPEKTKYLYREQGFSGSTLQAMSVSDIPILNFYDPIKPRGYIKLPEHNYLKHKLPGESHEGYKARSIECIESIIRENDPQTIAALVAETIMGSLRGDIVPVPGYWSSIRSLCDKYNIHLILDEIYCGMGRSGKVYCCEYDEVCPDFICIGKGAAGGYAPMSAVITKAEFEEIIAQGTGRIQLGHTFSGYAIGAAAMLATQKKVQQPSMLEHVCKMGASIRNELERALGDHVFFRDSRGRGLNSAIEYDCENVHLFSSNLQIIMRERHNILINAKWHRTTFTPAFIVSESQVGMVMELYVREFILLASTWNGNSQIELPRSFGGNAPGK